MNQFVPVLSMNFSVSAVQDKPKQYLKIICAFNLSGGRGVRGAGGDSAQSRGQVLFLFQFTAQQTSLTQ